MKQSSNELEPSSGSAGVKLAPARASRTVKDYLALAIATCGVGYLPIAPGTWGSLLGVGFYFLLQYLTEWLIRWFLRPNSVLFIARWPVFLAVELIVIVVLALVGIWAATRTEKLSGRKDPGKVVIDEVVGQLIALLPIAPKLEPGWISIVAAFLLFRLFDIVKPYPARRFEKLESGLGIVSDDIVAGAYAAVVTSVIVAVGLFAIN